jgi:hypothetical protein
MLSQILGFLYCLREAQDLTTHGDILPHTIHKESAS